MTGLELKNLLLEREVTQRQLAKYLNVQQAVVSRWTRDPHTLIPNEKILRARQFFALVAKGEIKREGVFRAKSYGRTNKKKAQADKQLDDVLPVNNFKVLVQTILDTPTDADTKVQLLESLCKQNI